MHPDADDVGLDDLEIRRIQRVLSELEPADHELLEPPAAVWAGIEASMVSPKEPPARHEPAGVVVEYRIDGNDTVIEVGRGWDDFARDNDAPGLVGSCPDGTLWTHFDSDETRELWQLLVQRVRSQQVGTRVPLRCDAPHARRWFEMTVTPEADGRVHFRSVLVFEELRSQVELLDPRSERDAGASPVAVCSWCGRGQHDSGWLDIEELMRVGRLLEQTSMPPIAHGICGACRDDMSAELLVPARVDERPV